jgi:hypothetical protein
MESANAACVSRWRNSVALCGRHGCRAAAFAIGARYAYMQPEFPNPACPAGFSFQEQKRTTRMAKKPGSNNKGEWVFFDVVYEDGSQRSNRRVPAELLGGLEKDEPARGYIIEQDREIAEKSGRAPLAIKSLARTGAKKK